MNTFPDLKKDQVALFRAEKRTGIILDEQFEIAVNNDQKVYTIFDSFVAARTFAEELINSNDEIEVIIYSGKEEVLFYSNE